VRGQCERVRNANVGVKLEGFWGCQRTHFINVLRTWAGGFLDHNNLGTSRYTGSKEYAAGVPNLLAGFTSLKLTLGKDAVAHQHGKSCLGHDPPGTPIR